MNQCERVTLSDSHPEVCIRQAVKCPNNCFKLLWYTSSIMYQIFFYISETPVVFKTNVKNENNEDVWICSIGPTAMILLTFMLFSYLCCCDMQQNRIQNMFFSMYVIN